MMGPSQQIINVDSGKLDRGVINLHVRFRGVVVDGRSTYSIYLNGVGTNMVDRIQSDSEGEELTVGIRIFDLTKR